MEQNIGFIGLGNMGQAILQGILSSGIVTPSQINVFGRNEQVLSELIKQHSINVLSSNRDVTASSDIVFVAVKPYQMNDVLLEIHKELKKSTIVVSVAAGVTIKSISAQVGYDQKIVRVMPNTPALINSAMSSITANTEVTAEELALIKKLLDCIGLSEIVPENQIHAVIGVSGSSPAYVFMFIEALADAGVKAGMSRQQAYQFAAQTVMGSAKLVLETGKHPAELKDMVCSPNGTTIEGVQSLENDGFRAAIINAVEACVNRSKALSGE